MAVRREYVEDLYRNVLGRGDNFTSSEVEGWMNAPDEQSVYNAFIGSPEYTAAHGGQATWQDVGGVITPTTPDLSTQSPGTSHGYNEPDIIGGSVPPPPPAATTYPPSASSGSGGSAPSSAAQAVIDYYKKYVNRDPLPGDVEKWLAGQYGWGSADNLAGIEQGIRSSEEAARYRASTPTTSYSTTPYTGVNANYDYSAFNTARQQDPGKSAKDAFLYISNQAPPAPMTDKAQLPAWFNTYVRPGFEALGHKVLSVDQDGFVYTNPEGTFRVDYVQNAGATGSTPGAPQRFQWNATPADAATAARYPTATTGGGTGTSTGTTTRTLSNLANLTNLGAIYGGPGGAGITTGPLQQVGQDPLSLLITGALANFLGAEGTTGFGTDVQDALSAAIAGGGELRPGQMARRYESARELLDKGRRTMINDLRGDLNARNLLSEPGIEQGPEISGIRRTTEAIAPEFARALRDIYTDEVKAADDRSMEALKLATGFSTDQARNLLAGIGEGTARQTALSNIALESLKTNMAWSQFLAEFGLERDKVMWEMENGAIDQYLPLLQTFTQLAGLSAAGHV